jgi:hypothetical protein
MCKHLRTEVLSDAIAYTGEEGPVYIITDHLYCLDCGAEVEPPALDVLEVDREPTRHEIEINAELPV